MIKPKKKKKKKLHFDLAQYVQYQSQIFFHFLKCQMIKVGLK
jgi:hypothetical protein